MANLFEINSMIEQAYESLIDPETGEIQNEDLLTVLDGLELERDEKIRNIGMWIKNLDAEAAALKEAKMSFAKRQSSVENKAESLRRYLSSALNGEKKTFTEVAISFRKSQAVVIEDETGFIQYAQNGHDEWLKLKDPEINKTAVKDAIKAGKEVRFAHIEDKQNIQVK